MGGGCQKSYHCTIFYSCKGNYLFSKCYILRQYSDTWEEHSTLPDRVLDGSLVYWYQYRYIVCMVYWYQYRYIVWYTGINTGIQSLILVSIQVCSLVYCYVLSQRHFPKGNFSSVQFPKRQLPKCTFSQMYIWEVAAWEIVHLRSCHLGSCRLGK